MNTSASPAAVLPTAEARKFSEAQPFPYPVVPGARGNGGDALAPCPLAGAEAEADGTEAGARQAQAREQGRQLGQSEARKAFEEQLERERSHLAAVIESFRKDRSVYFERVEAEVVHLALSIARKILHREAKIDPWVLAGITRVALDKIDGATQVTIRLHPQNTHGWRTFLATQLEPSAMPEIIEDPSQALDRCTLQTAMGTAEIGLEVQLKEIELGLADLLAARQETMGE